MNTPARSTSRAANVLPPPRSLLAEHRAHRALERIPGTAMRIRPLQHQCPTSGSVASSIPMRAGSAQDRTTRRATEASCSNAAGGCAPHAQLERILAGSALTQYQRVAALAATVRA